MIFPVYRTELALPGPQTTESAFISEYELRELYGTIPQNVGRIAVGEAVFSATQAYRLGETSPEPQIERVYDITNQNIHLSIVRKAEQEKEQMPQYDEEPWDLKARGQFNDIDVAIAGIFYPSNKYVGWMNIRPVIALYKTIPDEQQMKMLGL